MQGWHRPGCPCRAGVAGDLWGGFWRCSAQRLPDARGWEGRGLVAPAMWWCSPGPPSCCTSVQKHHQQHQFVTGMVKLPTLSRTDTQFPHHTVCLPTKSPQHVHITTLPEAVSAYLGSNTQLVPRGCWCNFPVLFLSWFVCQELYFIHFLDLCSLCFM